jgi:hypothetical protein
MSVPNIPIVNKGLLYVTGLQISIGALNADLLSTATLSIAAGQCRDSSDVNDITLSAAVTLNPAVVNQVNGLDTGTFAINTLYAVYAIADSKGFQPTGTLLSTNHTTPQLPGGYDMFRRIGAVLTNALAAPNTRFLNFHQRGNNAARDFWYAVPIATALAAGNAAVLTSFNWADATPANCVPLSAGKVYAKVALTADAGGTRTCVFSADGSTTIAAAATAGEVIVSSPASTVTTASLIIPATATAGPILPMTSFYAVSDAAAAVAVACQGYQDLL